MQRKSIGWVAILEPTDRCHLCPVCGFRSTPHKRGKSRLLKHRVIPHFGFVYVEVPVHHEQCSHCLAIWSVKWEGIPHRGTTTDQFKETVASLCQETTIKSVSRAYAIPYSSLERWYYEWAEAQKDLIFSKKETPRVVSMDDFATHKGHKYATSMVDYNAAQICQVTSGRKGESIKKALKKWPFSRPDLVIIDLAPGIQDIIHSVWPKTRIAADPFHVIQLFTKELDKCRKKLSYQNLPKKERKKTLRILTTKPKNLRWKEQLILEDWLSADWEVNELYQALQGIRHLYSKWLGVLTKKAFDAWIERYLFSPNRIVHRIAKTLVQWKEAVLTAMECQVSNGKMEGLNNKIKMMKRRAFGYRNFQHFERRLQLESS